MGESGRDTKGPRSWKLLRQWILLLTFVWAPGAANGVCMCDGNLDFRTFKFRQVREECCLNFTGSSIGALQWNVFTNLSGIKVLDLSNCNISDIYDVDENPSSLEVLYLDHNQLEQLPSNFLTNVPSLKILHLEENHLQQLPENILEASDQIQELYLDSNNLNSIPPSVFKPSLEKLSLFNNTLECTCALYDGLAKYMSANVSISRSENVIICYTSKHPQGLNIMDIHRSDICRSHGLTALFICLPLIATLALVLCWYCWRNRRSNFKVIRQDNQICTIEKPGFSNVGDHHYITCRTPETTLIPTGYENSILARNQLMLRPSTALLGSNRDLYEEVEIKLGGSVDSVTCVDKIYLNMSNNKVEEEDAVEEVHTEPELVSVTEELQEADRQRLYMNKSANYYNLVPGIELDDSDHGEYENIDLS
ncbi:leucine-rich repeat transmembrane protein FLRT3 isoform X1 [Carcharodon carcharias]|uniref:leucine-rich repeat transmembrane protein FLRT3 isoform X1 n=2 Tax=Carcharodon carcharias TaxID=13397 RepID=UPI001B7DD105|nr:leucine-rich repeat transmembrane protein FLRT3 isoform X1 [Carcharodon carcharias]